MQAVSVSGSPRQVATAVAMINAAAGASVALHTAARALPVPPPSETMSGRKPRQWPQGKLPSPGKEVGTVLRFFPEKGYGFVRVPGIEKEVFMHRYQVNCTSADERLRHWDVELRVVADRKDPRRLKAAAVSGPDGRRIVFGPRGND